MSRYKPYPAYKDTGVEWLGEVREGWEVSPFKRHIERNDGGVWGNDPSGTNDTVVIRSTEQTVDGQWIIHQPAIRQLSISEKQSALLEKDDLVVTKSSGSSLHIGKTTLVNKEIANLECCYSNFMQRLRMKPSFLPKLAWYVMNNIISRKQLDLSSNSTTGLANINSEMIGQLLLARPPESEQGHLVNGIDHETSFIDTLIQKNTRLMELLKEKRSALITHAVTKGLDPNVKMKESGVEWIGEVPEGWGISSVQRAAKRIQTGSTPPTHESRYYENGEVSWYGPSSFGPTLTLGAPQKKISNIAILDGVARLFAPQTCLIVTIGTVGKVGQLNSAGSTNQQITAVEFNERIANPRYASYAIKCLEPVMSGIATNTTLPIISQTTIGELKIPFPSVTEQSAIANFLDHETSIIDTLIAKTKFSIDILKERRSAFITAAVTGQIDLREAA